MTEDEESTDESPPSGSLTASELAEVAESATQVRSSMLEAARAFENLPLGYESRLYELSNTVNELYSSGALNAASNLAMTTPHLSQVFSEYNNRLERLANDIPSIVYPSATTAASTVDWSNLLSAITDLQTATALATMSSLHPINPLNSVSSTPANPDFTPLRNHSRSSESPVSPEVLQIDPQTGFGSEQSLVKDIQKYTNQVNAQISFERTYNALQMCGNKIDTGFLLFISYIALSSFSGYLGVNQEVSARIIGFVLAVIYYAQQNSDS